MSTKHNYNYNITMFTDISTIYVKEEDAQAGHGHGQEIGCWYES